MEKPYDIHDYEVLDRNGRPLGAITGFWVDESTGKPEFASIKTGWLMGKNHLIPIRDAHFDYAGKRLRVPYAEERIRNAPSFAPEHRLSPQEEERIYSHYRLERSLSRSPSGLPSRGEAERTGPLGQAGAPRGPASERETVEMPLREERVDVGTRQVEGDTVRLRKVVKTETREIPVDLMRERVQIERIPASELKGTYSGRSWGEAFREDEVVMTERREEPEIRKTTDVVGGVRATREIETERRDVRADVRREEVDVERDDEAGRGVR